MQIPAPLSTPATPAPRQKNSPAATLIRALLSVAILAYVFYTFGIETMTATLAQANPPWLAAGALVLLTDQLVFSLAWTTMLGNRNLDAPFRRVLSISLVSEFYGLVMPSSLGPDVLRVVRLGRHIKSGADALSSLFFFRVMGYGLSFAITLVALFFLRGRLPADRLGGSLAVFMAGGIALLATGILAAGPILALVSKGCARFGLEKIGGSVTRLAEGLRFFSGRPGPLAAAIAGSLYLQTSRILFVVIVARALAVPAELATFFAFVPVITALTTLPVSVSGFGIREGGYVLFFGAAGVNAGQAVALSFAGFALALIVPLAGGVLSLAGTLPFTGKPGKNMRKTQ